MDTATSSPRALRDQMVDRILTTQQIAAPVVDALRRVERHRYLPAAPLADAYADQAVITHTSPDGAHLSCASDPTVVAAMLGALEVQPGQRILEVGAGTGYNAALLSTLAGPGGQVISIDINAEVTAAARHNLADTGFSAVRVVTGDGADGVAELSPYDRIVVTVGAWDIPWTWWDQLVPQGRLVLPLRWRGTTRAVAFTKGESSWRSDWVFLCGFVPMIGQPGEQRTVLGPDSLVALHYDADQAVDVHALDGVLGRQRSEVWSEATVHGEEPFDRIWLRLTATEQRTVRIEADQRAVASGLCTPAIASRSPALADDDSLAYFTIRRAPIAGRWQLGAIGHGPFGRRLAERIVDQIHAWDRARSADPEILAYPVGLDAPSAASGHVISKPETTLIVRY